MSRVICTSIAVGLILMVASCGEAYYYGIDEDPIGFDREEYETSRAWSEEGQYADFETAEALDATHEAEVWKDLDKTWEAEHAP